MADTPKLSRDIERLINYRSNTVAETPKPYIDARTGEPYPDSTPNRLGITRGEARVEQIEYPQGLDISFEVSAVDTGRNICQTIMAEKGKGWRGKLIDEDRANMHLIADAFNTANKTQKLPSELQAEVVRLREAIQKHIDSDFASGKPDHYQRTGDLRAALARDEQE